MSNVTSIDQDSLNQLRSIVVDLSVIAEDLMKGFAAERPTLRDQFAMAALAGYMAYPGTGSDGGFDKAKAAAFCYATADAMLAARQTGAKS